MRKLDLEDLEVASGGIAIHSLGLAGTANPTPTYGAPTFGAPTFGAPTFGSPYGAPPYGGFPTATFPTTTFPTTAAPGHFDMSQIAGIANQVTHSPQIMGIISQIEQAAPQLAPLINGVMGALQTGNIQGLTGMLGGLTGGNLGNLGNLLGGIQGKL